MDTPESTPTTPEVAPKVTRRAKLAALTMGGLHEFRNAMREPDNLTPSSSRWNGTVIILALVFCEMLIVTVLTLLLWRCSSDLALKTLYAHTLVTVVIATFSIFMATALSFYGINVWKWVASIAQSESSALTGIMKIPPQQEILTPSKGDGTDPAE